MKKLSLILLTLLTFGLGQMAYAQTSYNPGNYQDLVAYINQCSENDYITLDANILLESRLEISANKVVNLRLAG